MSVPREPLPQSHSTQEASSQPHSAALLSQGLGSKKGFCFFPPCFKGSTKVHLFQKDRN